MIEPNGDSDEYDDHLSDEDVTPTTHGGDIGFGSPPSISQQSSGTSEPNDRELSANEPGQTPVTSSSPPSVIEQCRIDPKRKDVRPISDEETPISPERRPSSVDVNQESAKMGVAVAPMAALLAGIGPRLSEVEDIPGEGVFPRSVGNDLEGPDDLFSTSRSGRDFLHRDLDRTTSNLQRASQHVETFPGDWNSKESALPWSDIAVDENKGDSRFHYLSLQTRRMD